MDYTNTKQLNTELARRAQNLGLPFAVGGDGIISAEVAIIGEAPGIREMEAGSPFVGQSGNILWTCLRNHCNLNRLNCYVTNVIKHQVAVTAGADEMSKVSKTELAYWTDILDFELQQLPNLKFVMLLGNYATQAVLEKKGITNWRGTVMKHTLDNGKEVTAMCFYNPALVLRDPTFQPVFQIDTKKFNRVLKGEFKEHEIKHHINPTFKEAYDWCERMIDENKPVSFDIETTSAQETVCVGFANNAHEGMCINFRELDRHHFSVVQEIAIRKKIGHILAHPKSKLVAQNGNFDSYWLWYKDRIKSKPIWFDTMLAHHTLYPILPHSLGFLTSMYTNHPYYKDDGKFFKEGLDVTEEDFNTYWRYNVKDVCITFAAHEKLLKELQDQKLDDFFFKHVMKAQPELTKMTVLGTKCDVALKDQINVEMTADLEKRKEQIYADIKTLLPKVYDKHGELIEDYRPNLKSPRQLPDLFYNKLMLPATTKRSADAPNRERLLALPTIAEPVKKLIADIDEYLTERTFVSNSINMVVDVDDRIRCDYKQTGVKSAPGRLSSSATLWGSGTNLQNQPERAQKMFIADEGYEFTYTDGSQAEARVVATIGNVAALKDNFARSLEDKSFDVHRANAARIFKQNYDDIPTYDRNPETGKITTRFLGKRCVHGLNYRMSADKLAETCGIGISQAMDAYYAYHNAFPEIKKWWNRTLEEVRKTRMLFNCLGRRFILLGANPYEQNDALDSIIAFVPQSTIGDWVIRLIYKCHSDPEWPKTATICLNIHDALIARNKIEDGITVRRIMKKYAEEPIRSPYGDIHIPFEFKTSVADGSGIHRWSSLKASPK